MIYRINSFQNHTILDIILHGKEIHGKEMAGMAFCPMFSDLAGQEDNLTFEMNRQESLDLVEMIEASLDHMEEPYLTEADMIAQMLRRIAGEPDEGGMIVHDLSA
jgi:predicted DNA-binding protein